MNHLRPSPGSENRPIECGRCKGNMEYDLRSGYYHCLGSCGLRVSNEVGTILYGGTPSEIANGFYSSCKLVFPPEYMVTCPMP